MAATRIQTIAAVGSVVSGATITFAANVVVGRTIVVMMLNQYAPSIPSFIDNLGNEYIRVVTTASAGSINQFMYAFAALITTGGACTLTLSMSSSTAQALFAAEVSGLAASPFESYNAFNNTTSPLYAGSVTPTVNGSYLMAIFFDGSSTGVITQGSAWTDQGAFANGRRLQDLVQTTAAAINADATSTTPGNINGWVVVFKAASAGTTKRRQSILRKSTAISTSNLPSKLNILSRAAVPYVSVNVVQGVTSKSSFFHRRRIR